MCLVRACLVILNYEHLLLCVTKFKSQNNGVTCGGQRASHVQRHSDNCYGRDPCFREDTTPMDPYAVIMDRGDVFNKSM